MLLLYLPIAVIIVYSFNYSETDAVWGGFTTGWYRTLFANRRLLDSVANSVRVTMLAVCISVVLGTFGAVAAARCGKFVKRSISALIFTPLILPEIILGTGLLLFFTAMPVNFGILAIALAHTTFCIPYIYIFVSIRLKKLDPALIDAARDLGAGACRTFFAVTLPSILPAVTTGALISAAMSLDSVVMSSLLSAPDSITFPVRLFSLMRIGTTPEVNALSALMIVAMFGFAAVGFFLMRVKKNE